MRRKFVQFRNIIAAMFVVLCLVGTLAARKINFDFTGDYEGLYLLSGANGFWYELTDDLFPEEADRMIFGMPVTWMKKVVTATHCTAGIDSCINFEWNERTGRGFVMNNYPDGRKLLICISRFVDSSNIFSKGIFVGGNLPASNSEFQYGNQNETGMAYFDGKRFYHIWCNVNEAMWPALNPAAISSPAQWEFLGSTVVENSAKDVTLSSRHRALIGGTPYDIDKFLFYEAGDAYFTLVTKITNRSNTLASFVYLYGDEPFLGNYGSSRGNIGWLKGGIVTTESFFDTRSNMFAGMFDYGNPLAGEKHGDFTGKANFIEWDRASRPDTGYFANKEGGTGFEPNKPLANPENRFIGLQWGPHVLAPNESFTFKLAIGMAGNNPVSGFPSKPVTHLD